MDGIVFITEIILLYLVTSITVFISIAIYNRFYRLICKKNTSHRFIDIESAFLCSAFWFLLIPACFMMWLFDFVSGRR